jgi:hypothetical protein
MVEVYSHQTNSSSCKCEYLDALNLCFIPPFEMILRQEHSLLHTILFSEETAELLICNVYHVAGLSINQYASGLP